MEAIITLIEALRNDVIEVGLLFFSFYEDWCLTGGYQTISYQHMVPTALKASGKIL